MEKNITLIFADLTGKNTPEVHIADHVISSAMLADPHRHDFFEFFIVQKGLVIHRLDGSDYLHTTGDLCLILPHNAHTLGVKRNSGDAVITNVAFPADLFLAVYRCIAADPMAAIAFQRYSMRPSAKSLEAMRALIGLLQDKRETMEKHKPVILRTLLAELIAEIFLASSAPGNSVPEWLANAVHEMEKRENYEQGTGRFVQLCGKSQEHCIRSMKAHYRTTPSAFVNSLKLKAAANKLATTRNSVLEVLLDAGFNNVSHFNSTFKKQYGLTPREYRRRNQQVVFP